VRIQCPFSIRIMAGKRLFLSLFVRSGFCESKREIARERERVREIVRER